MPVLAGRLVWIFCRIEHSDFSTQSQKLFWTVFTKKTVKLRTKNCMICIFWVITCYQVTYLHVKNSFSKKFKENQMPMKGKSRKLCRRATPLSHLPVFFSENANTKRFKNCFTGIFSTLVKDIKGNKKNGVRMGTLYAFTCAGVEIRKFYILQMVEKCVL